MAEIGKNIRKYRKNSGYTQEELANLLHVTAQAVSRWESGAGKPEVSILVPLARTLGISLDTLFDAGTADEEERGTLSQQLDSIRYAGLPREEMYLRMYRLVRKAADRNMADFDLLGQCVVLGCFAVKYSRQILGEEFGGVDALIQDCERKTSAVVRFSGDRKLIEMTHTYMGWTYEFVGLYDRAREHIMELPTYESMQMRESMLAQLTLFQSGFDAEMKDINNNMKTLSELTANELQRAMMDIGQYGTRQQAEEFGQWVRRVAEAFCKNPHASSAWEECLTHVKFYLDDGQLGKPVGG